MPAAATPSSFLRCQVCTALLSKVDKHRDVGVCDDCADRPEGKKILRPKASAQAAAHPARIAATPGPRPVGVPPTFTAPEVSLIVATGAHLPADDLLKLLNDRLVADRGPGVVPHTAEQLRDQIASLRSTSTDRNWSAQRRRLAKARKDGVLQHITPQVIDDFAIVFQLSAAQVTHLREAIGSAQEE